MVAIVGGLCMEGLWRGWRFTMIDRKKLQDMFGCGIYTVLSSNGNACVLLTLKNLQLVLIF